MLIDYMSTGRSFMGFGGEINIGRTTLYNWVKEYDEFKEAKEIGEAKGLSHLESLAYAACIGLKRDKNGKEIKPNGFMIQFILATRFNEFYSKREINQHEIGKSFDDLKNKSDEELNTKLSDLGFILKKESESKEKKNVKKRVRTGRKNS